MIKKLMLLSLIFCLSMGFVLNIKSVTIYELNLLRESVEKGQKFDEAIKAAERLSQDDVETVIVDCYCIKPFNTKRFIELVKKSGNKVVIVEDHYKEGGIGEMIMAASAGNNIEFEHLCVREMPHSGTKEKLMEIEGIMISQ